MFIQGDNSRLGEIKRNPTKGSRGAKKAEDEARANSVPDQPTPPPEPKQEDSSPPRPIKRLKLTLKSADESSAPPTPSQSHPRPQPLTTAVVEKKEDSVARPRARLEVDESMSGAVVDEKGVLRTFVPAPPTGTDFRKEIKWGRIQG